MARGYNRVVLMGNLARDPDVRHTPTKIKVARITVAVGNQWKDKNTGELQSHTDFINVSAWRGLADLCDRYLRKGRPVLVEGRLSVRDYDDPKTGTRKWVTEVVADNIVLLSSGRREDEASYDQRPRQQQQQPAARPPQRSDYSAADVGSLRDEVNFDDEFPLDFSEMSDSNGEGPGDVDIPF